MYINWRHFISSVWKYSQVCSEQSVLWIEIIIVDLNVQPVFKYSMTVLNLIQWMNSSAQASGKCNVNMVNTNFCTSINSESYSFHPIHHPNSSNNVNFHPFSNYWRNSDIFESIARPPGEHKIIYENAIHVIASSHKTPLVIEKKFRDEHLRMEQNNIIEKVPKTYWLVKSNCYSSQDRLFNMSLSWSLYNQ